MILAMFVPSVWPARLGLSDFCREEHMWGQHIGEQSSRFAEEKENMVKTDVPGGHEWGSSSSRLNGGVALLEMILKRKAIEHPTQELS